MCPVIICYGWTPETNRAVGGNPLRLICVLVWLSFFSLPGADRFVPVKTGAPFSTQCESGEGNEYQVVVWTQVSGSELKPDQTPLLKGLVRVVIFGGVESVTQFCPRIIVDGKSDLMYSRVTLNSSYDCFPISVCEYPITSEDKDIQVVTTDGSTFSAPPLCIACCWAHYEMREEAEAILKQIQQFWLLENPTT